MSEVLCELPIFAASLIDSPSSIVSPSTLKRRPNVFSPTGTLIPLPVSSNFHISAKTFTGCQHNTAYNVDYQYAVQPPSHIFYLHFVLREHPLIAGKFLIFKFNIDNRSKNLNNFSCYSSKKPPYIISAFYFLLFLLRLRTGYYLRNLLRDRSLSGSVILNIQFF